MNEVIKSMMYRHLGYVHPMQLFIKSMMSTKTEAIEDTYATFDHDMLEKMTRKLIEDSKEDNKEDD
jgi:hypothetical protein